MTPANEQERAQIGELADQVQAVTGQSVKLAFIDQGYTGEEPAKAGAERGIRLEVVKHSEAKHGFVLLPPLGGRAQLRLDGSIPSPRPRL